MGLDKPGPGSVSPGIQPRTSQCSRIPTSTTAPRLQTGQVHTGPQSIGNVPHSAPAHVLVLWAPAPSPGKLAWSYGLLNQLPSDWKRREGWLGRPEQTFLAAVALGVFLGGGMREAWGALIWADTRPRGYPAAASLPPPNGLLKQENLMSSTSLPRWAP